MTRQQLAAELTQISRRLPELYRGPPDYARTIARHSALVDPVLERMIGRTATTSLWVLLVSVSLVLLIACANVANLFMGARRGPPSRPGGAPRHRGDPHAAGQAPDGRGLPGGAGGRVLAMALGVVTLPMFIRAAPEGIPRLGLVHLDAPTLAMAFGLVLVVALACGIVPALRASSPDLRRLREGGRGATGRHRWARNGLVVAQTALALVLLIGSALLVRSFRKLSHVDPGYETRDLYTFQYAPDQERFNNGPTWGQLHLDFMERLRALPASSWSGVVNNIPLDEGTGGGRWLTENMASDAGGILLDQNFTGGDYFRAMGIDLLRGRIFTTDEAITPNTSVIISKSAAEKLWPGQDAMGRQLRRRMDDTLRTFTVVGIVEDVKQDDWRDAGGALVYFPLTGPTADMWGMGSPAYVIKTPRAATIGREVRDLVRQVAPEAPVYREYTMEFLAQRSMCSSRSPC